MAVRPPTMSRLGSPLPLSMELLEDRCVPALVAAFGFEEASGTTATDSSGLNNVGTLSGPSRVTGRFGQGLSFNGVNNLVTVADANSLDLTTGMTLEAWVQPTAKFKTPADFIHSTHRALALPLREKRRAVQPFEALGQRIHMPGSPAGWPDTSADWDGPSALLKRIAWVDSVGQRVGDERNARELGPRILGATLGDETARAVARAETGAQAMTLLLASPEFMRR